MKRLNHFRKAQLKLTAQYFLVSLVIIILANLFSSHLVRRTVLPAQFLKNGAGFQHGRVTENRRVDNTHRIFIVQLLRLDIYLLVIAVGASYLLSGRALKPIREMVRRQEEFASDVSHELRTPLATISMEIEAIRRTESELPEPYSELLDSIQEETRHMTGIVSGLLTVVRPEHADDKNSRVPLDLAVIVTQAVKRAEPSAIAKRISLATKKLDKAPIIGNEEQIKQVVLILLDNAIRYTPNGGTVTLATASHNKTASLSVADTGPGIPAEDHTRIFERFYRAGDKTAHAEHGTGLGLAIARKLVESHDGAISLDSAPEKGSIFTINLPRHS